MIVDEHEYLDFSRVPESQGIPGVVRVVVAIGVLGVFIMGGLSVGMSGFGHCSNPAGASACSGTASVMWPSEKTMRMPLAPMPGK